MSTLEWIRLAVVLAGTGQLVLFLACPAIPVILKWREDTDKLRSLTRQIFWTYSIYIWLTILSIGLLSVLGAEALLDGGSLARAVSLYMALFWVGRVVLQFVFLNKQDVPSGLLPRLADVALSSLFVYLAVTYSLAFSCNLGLL